MTNNLELTEQENLTYLRLKKPDYKNYHTITEKRKIIQEALKAAERYKKNCITFKNNSCIYCLESNLKIIKNVEFVTFKCLTCKKIF